MATEKTNALPKISQAILVIIISLAVWKLWDINIWIVNRFFIK